VAARSSGHRALLAACLISALSLLQANSLFAEDADVNAQRLQQLRQQMQQLELTINTLRKDRSGAYQELVSLERKLDTLHRQLRHLDHRLREKEKALSDNQASQRQLRSSMGTQKRSISNHIRTAYLLGSQAHIKLLLNQQQSGDVSRSLAYYRYLTSARLQRVEEIEDTLEKQRRLAKRIQQQQAELTRLRQQKLADRQEIDGYVSQRKLLLAKLDLRLRDHNARKQELEEDQRRLERLVDRIQQVESPPPAPGLATGRFAQQRRRLDLPVAGEILARFGARRKAGDQHWNGIFISASEGRNVRSVFAGRVVFAGWLHGFGMLMILDHGDGYMTLYGHNRSLYKVVGDWVETGEVIASVGDTGNPPRTGLYFGVRQKGKPQDPLYWCRVRR
jgi:septal ring factor EnvC (AmiA/AmiB activator)